MPAAMRGGSRVQAKPRAKAPASTKARPQPKKQGAYAPGKLKAARGVGLSPAYALAAAAAVLALTMGVTLATGGRGLALHMAMNEAVGSEFASLGFKLKAVHVQGASPMATADILKAAGVYKDQPVLGLNLEEVRKRVETVGWVKEARVVRLLPDTLVLAVVERRQLAVWQSGGKSRVIDETGRVIPEADPREFPNLPLIVGAGANEFAAQILPEVAARPRLAERLEALVRVDGRRWDLRLKDGSLVQLPAVDEGAALIQLEQLDQRSRILELGFERIDLRDPTTVAVRPRDGALPGQLVANGA
ncbi:MAG: cell division protein FtsQ/DivIB [Phenylobacterium sp.]|uniref:cell division protein FtsQ/DivIB n=1 Tax=Phenylobacterium sp. TaxID=1871053 RepID=UPI002732D6EC|nr:cell division protein FtsQ/DivIB [Phenylobacterium sp.]MDP3746941.1 cell division protein FtsQ/DivIB [Phenylobacterium sp.]